MLAPNPSQHLKSQPVSQRNPSQFHQSVKRSKTDPMPVVGTKPTLRNVRWPVALGAKPTLGRIYDGVDAPDGIDVPR